MIRFSVIPLALAAAFILAGADRPSTSTASPDVHSPPVPPPPMVAAHEPASFPLHRRSHPSSPSLVHVAAANHAATQEPRPQGFINAVQVYPFVDGMIYRVYAAPEHVTDIVLQPGETLGAVAAGDTVRWVIGDTSSGSADEKRSHILIKPFAAGLTTNVIITTDRRSYHLSLVSTASTAMASLSWTYPQDALIAFKHERATAEAAVPVAQGLTLDSLRFGYRISGDTPPWRPLRAFDDGRQTFIEFPASISVGEAPPLFVLGPAGVAELVNYRVKGHFYIVDRLFGAAELRLGTRHQDIVRITRDPDAGTGVRARRAS